MSKEKPDQKRSNRASGKTTHNQPSAKSRTTIRPLGKQPRSRRRTNIRFFILLGIWLVALVLGLLFVTGRI